jgi:preprotein translocase subunit YajC
MNFSLIDVALAQGAKPAQPSLVEILVMPLAFLVIMFFLVIRPQQKRQKEQSELLNSLKVGDEVITSAGIIGRVKAVAEQFVTLEAGPSTTFKIQKSHISSSVKPKTEKDK